MAERFNYTNRAAIAGNHVHVRLAKQGGDWRFTAKIDFEHYQFPASGRVFIEAYRKNLLIRFDFGTVGAFAAPADTSVAVFGDDVSAILYRVKVVGNDAHRSILGMSSRGIGVRAENGEGGASDCILPLGRLPAGSEQVWAMDFEGEYPRLCVNRDLDPAALKADFFLALVYPAALRSVLEYTFLRHFDGKDCAWADDWKQFAAVNLEEPFPDISDSTEIDVGYCQTITDWIKNVLDAFVANAGLVEKVNGGAL